MCPSQSLRESSWATTVHCSVSSSHHREVFHGNIYIEQDMDKIILSFYLKNATVPWGLTCSWSSAMQSITPHETNTHSSLSLSTSEEESLLDTHAPPAQYDSPQECSGLQQKLCSRTCVCDPIFWLCLFSLQYLWLPRPSAGSIPCITSLEGGIIQRQSIFIWCKDVWNSKLFQTSSTHL